MKPWKTLKDLLVHPKDKQDKEDIRECVYKVPCANCDKTLCRRNCRKVRVRLHEHKTEVECKTKWAFTRSQHTASLTDYSNSALTDHANQANHTVDWKKRLRSSTENKTILPGGSRKLQGKSSSYESRWGQLSAEPRLRPLSWRDSWSSHQDSEELSTSSSDEHLVMRSKPQNKV